MWRDPNSSRAALARASVFSQALHRRGYHLVARMTATLDRLPRHDRATKQAPNGIFLAQHQLVVVVVFRSEQDTKGGQEKLMDEVAVVTTRLYRHDSSATLAHMQAGALCSSSVRLQGHEIYIAIERRDVWAELAVNVNPALKLNCTNYIVHFMNYTCLYLYF